MKISYKLTCLLLGISTLLSPLGSRSQNSIRIVKAGHDSITIYNMAPHAILLEFANKKPVYIYRNEGFTTHFKLSIGNVRKIDFRISYDKTCFDMDEQQCNGIHKPCQGCLLPIFIKCENGIIPSLFACMLEQWTPERSKRAAEICASDLSEGEKRLQFSEICLECCKENEKKQQSNCIVKASYYLNHPPKPETYRAQDLIRLQQNFALDFYPYYLAGFKVQGLTNIGFSDKKYFGFRTSLNFNLYKHKRRIQGSQVSIPLDYQQSPLGYIKNTNTALPDTGYSWKNYSVGIGYRFFVYEGLYRNFLRTTGVIIDAGLSLSSRTKYILSKEKVATKAPNNTTKSVISGYVNFGYQLALFRGIGLYGSYYTTVQFKKNQPVLEAPRIAQFNLGLYLNLFTSHSYQY